MKYRVVVTIDNVSESEEEKHRLARGDASPTLREGVAEFVDWTDAADLVVKFFGTADAFITAKGRGDHLG